MHCHRNSVILGDDLVRGPTGRELVAERIAKKIRERLLDRE